MLQFKIADLTDCMHSIRYCLLDTVMLQDRQRHHVIRVDALDVVGEQPVERCS